jgi:hypothetical protein
MAEDRRVQDRLVSVGMLVCSGCKGSFYRGNCHAVTSAEQALRAAGQSVVGWIGPAPEPEQLERAIGAEHLNNFGGVR